MKTIDKNHLIADFMGAKFGIDPTLRLDVGECWLPIHGICNYMTVELGKGKILEYHKSWDWLMPVINKIKSITEEPEELDVLKDLLWFGTIEEVYGEVVDIIEQFNKEIKL